MKRMVRCLGMCVCERERERERVREGEVQGVVCIFEIERCKSE